MSTKLPTGLLQELVAKVVKGSSMIDGLPLTCLMEIKIENNVLTLRTTDNVNQLVLSASIETSDFCAVVDSKLFSNIIAKLSTVTFDLEQGNNKSVVIKAGTGKYDIPAPVDVDGSLIKFPNVTNIENATVNKISKDDIKSILTLNKVCKANVKEHPALFNYYADKDQVLTYDFFKSCNNPIKLVEDAVCIPPAVMELIPCVADDSGVSIVYDGSDNIQAFSSLGRLYGKTASKQELDTFPKDGIVNSYEEDLPYTCKINKNMLLSALERINLFVDVTSNQLTLSFKNDQITLMSKKTGSYESILYMEPLDATTPELTIDIDSRFLKDVLSMNTDDIVTIKFGTTKEIQVYCGKVGLILTTLDEV